jgi:hypothetical protein
MALSGITGYVEIGVDPAQVPYGFSKWKLSFRNNMPNVSGFHSGGYHANVKGKTMATLTLSGPYDGAMPLAVGEEYEFHLGFTATLELVVHARIGELTPANDYEDRPTLDVTAESNGVIVAEVV